MQLHPTVQKHRGFWVLLRFQFFHWDGCGCGWLVVSMCGPVVGQTTVLGGPMNAGIGSSATCTRSLRDSNSNINNANNLRCNRRQWEVDLMEAEPERNFNNGSGLLIPHWAQCLLKCLSCDWIDMLVCFATSILSRPFHNHLRSYKAELSWVPDQHTADKDSRRKLVAVIYYNIVKVPKRLKWKSLPHLSTPHPTPPSHTHTHTSCSEGIINKI